ncbi:hypothetical protein [Bacillus sp. B1-b2]|uniref:hypothetical protein n=1 Tax=Bacillus sp. B1-b2 TaxID=2653201 RepID=UPI001261C946|nr:hypothetical protein [Bacillus sp. B1-b2]KAB7672641.1 hypothetical protein F9279_03195 [Bacillus sp. B1-b2]
MKRKMALFILLFTGVGAFISGLFFIFDPTGRSMGMKSSILPSSLFEDFLIPGIILLSMIGIGHFLVFILCLYNHSKFSLSLQLIGSFLCSWIIIQIIMIGLSSIFQPIFLAIGIFEVIIAPRWITKASL